jgi:hypothetical protein
MPLNDREIKEAALVGLRYKRTEIEEQISRLERELQGATSAPARKKRKMSAAGRKRIADAARKRWAQYWADKEAASKPAKQASARGPQPAAKRKATARKKTAAKGTKKAASRKQATPPAPATPA